MNPTIKNSYSKTVQDGVDLYEKEENKEWRKIQHVIKLKPFTNEFGADSDHLEMIFESDEDF